MSTISQTVPPADDWIRGITIRQPWAACIVHGSKRIENRPKPWSWRGWLLLHAGLRIDRPALDDPLVASATRGAELTTSAVLGVARLASCHADDGPCSPWAHSGEHHLVLTDVTALPRPVPATGALGPWKPRPHVLDQVLLQLPHLRPARYGGDQKDH